MLPARQHMPVRPDKIQRANDRTVHRKQPARMVPAMQRRPPGGQATSDGKQLEGQPTARILSVPMGKTLGQPIINNKPGAATNIGADYAAKAKADGYVMLTGDTATLAANPALYSKLSYNVEKDFAPVGLMARFPMILVVNPSVPAKNLTEFLAWARKQADGVNYATPRAATSTSCPAGSMLSASPVRSE